LPVAEVRLLVDFTASSPAAISPPTPVASQEIKKLLKRGGFPFDEDGTVFFEEEPASGKNGVSKQIVFNHCEFG
jgi:hypothetical protein